MFPKKYRFRFRFRFELGFGFDSFGSLQLDSIVSAICFLDVFDVFDVGSEGDGLDQGGKKACLFESDGTYLSQQTKNSAVDI